MTTDYELVDLFGDPYPGDVARALIAEWNATPQHSRTRVPDFGVVLSGARDYQARHKAVRNG